MSKDINNVPAFKRLDKEIQTLEESRRLGKDNINNFINSQKPKKKLKNRILAWILGGAIFAGAAVGGAIAYTQNNGDGGYNAEIDRRYEQVEEKLIRRLTKETPYEDLINGEITFLKFNEPTTEDVNLQVYYKGVNDHTNELMRSCAVYKVMLEYYNSLVDAEESGNALTYLDALEEVFTKMTFLKEDSQIDIPCKLPQVTEENVNKFHEIFALEDTVNDDIVKQIGFLPYNVELIKYEFDSEKREAQYAYKISGISYCETKSENSDSVKECEELIMNEKYDKNHIKAFNREMIFSTSLGDISGISDKISRLKGDIYMIIDGVNNPYTVETTLFKEINITKLYEEIKLDETKFEMPEDFDLKGYKEVRKEIEENTK